MPSSLIQGELFIKSRSKSIQGLLCKPKEIQQESDCQWKQKWGSITFIRHVTHLKQKNILQLNNTYKICGSKTSWLR